jgi:hypothetical protein
LNPKVDGNYIFYWIYCDFVSKEKVDMCMQSLHCFHYIIMTLRIIDFFRYNFILKAETQPCNGYVTSHISIFFENKIMSVHFNFKKLLLICTRIKKNEWRFSKEFGINIDLHRDNFILDHRLIYCGHFSREFVDNPWVENCR